MNDIRLKAYSCFGIMLCIQRLTQLVPERYLTIPSTFVKRRKDTNL